MPEQSFANCDFRRMQVQLEYLDTGARIPLVEELISQGGITIEPALRRSPDLENSSSIINGCKRSNGGRDYSIHLRYRYGDDTIEASVPFRMQPSEPPPSGEIGTDQEPVIVPHLFDRSALLYKLDDIDELGSVLRPGDLATGLGGFILIGGEYQPLPADLSSIREQILRGLVYRFEVRSEWNGKLDEYC
jgi:hypothetical protein